MNKSQGAEFKENFKRENTASRSNILFISKIKILDGNKEIHTRHKKLPSTDCPDVCNSDTICLIKENKLKCL